MRDLYNNIKTSVALAPQVITSGSGTLTGAAIDIQGFDSLDFDAMAGTEAGVLCATAYYDIVLQGAEDDPANIGTPLASTWADVTDADDILGTFVDAANGVIARFNDTTATPGVVKVGYVGATQAEVRFLRVLAVPVGVPGDLPIAVLASQGKPHGMPVTQ